VRPRGRRGVRIWETFFRKTLFDLACTMSLLADIQRGDEHLTNPSLQGGIVTIYSALSGGTGRYSPPKGGKTWPISHGSRTRLCPGQARTYLISPLRGEVIRPRTPQGGSISGLLVCNIRQTLTNRSPFKGPETLTKWSSIRCNLLVTSNIFALSAHS
jgi:hypothetical protein